MTKSSNNKGFTLIELLVVIAIIGLLSTLAVVALNSARSKSRDAKRIADVKQVQTALELYYADNNGYPAATGLLLGTTNGVSKLAGNGFCGGTTSCTGTTYMGLVPLAPTTQDGLSCSTKYQYDGTTAAYTIVYCLGSNTGDVISGSHTATPNGIQ